MENKPSRKVACPSCGGEVVWAAESRFRPFCSERCRTADLGAWASNQYRVAGQETPGSDLPPDAAE